MLAEREIDAPNNSVCSTASKFDRADGSGCGASGGSMQAAATRRTAAAKAQVTRWSRPRDRLAATKTSGAPAPRAQPYHFFRNGRVPVVKGTASPR